MSGKDYSMRSGKFESGEIAAVMKQVGPLKDDVDELITPQVQETYKSPMKHRDVVEVLKPPTHKIKLPDEYELEKLASKHVWKSLPDSVNGTLLYFLL